MFWGDTKATALGCTCRVEATNGLHNSEIQHMGKCRTALKTEYKATPAGSKESGKGWGSKQRGQALPQHSSQTGRCSVQGSWCWVWNGPGERQQHFSTDLWVAEEVTPLCLFFNSIPRELLCSYNTCTYTLPYSTACLSYICIKWVFKILSGCATKSWTDLNTSWNTNKIAINLKLKMPWSIHTEYLILLFPQDTHH